MRGVCPSRRREHILCACQTAPPPASPFPTFWRVKGHQASFHANKRRRKKSVTDKSGILQILKFVVALLITAFQFAPATVTRPHSCEIEARSTKLLFQTGAFDQNSARIFQRPFVHLSIFSIHSQGSDIGAGVVLLSFSNHIQHSHACFWGEYRSRCCSFIHLACKHESA